MAEEKTVAEIDYSTMGLPEILEAIGKAYKARDMKLMASLSKLYTKKEAEAEKAKKDALLAELVKVTQDVRLRFTALAKELVDSGLLDGAEGIWFAYDFGEKQEVGINPALRLVKTGRKASGEAGKSGGSSYVANPAKSSDLLAQVGTHVMFDKDTTVTIDKTEQIVAAGTTFQQAYDFSTNGGWRNRVRMALLKAAGVI